MYNLSSKYKDDCWQAVLFALNKTKEFNFDVNRMALWGDSAGKSKKTKFCSRSYQLQQFICKELMPLRLLCNA